MIVDMAVPDNNVDMKSQYAVSARQGFAENIKTTYVSSFSTTSGVKIMLFQLNGHSRCKTTSLSIRSFSREYEELLGRLPWVADFFGTASELTDVKSLLPYYKEINNLILNKQFEVCDNFLQQVRAEELSDVLLVGLLRLTNNWKSELPAWKGLLVRSRKEIERRGNDSRMLLKGLA